MRPYQHIFVGVNYTDSSQHALQQANRIARESGATIEAFHAVSPVELNEFIAFYYVERETMMRSAQASLEAFVEASLGPGHQVKCRVADGIPHHEVVSHAQESNADLLVIGSDDYTTDPRKSGKFALKCLRFALTPVLLVRNQADHPFAKITACIDFSNSTAPIFENAARMAFDEDQLIEVAHATRPPWLRPPRLRYEIEINHKEDQKKQFYEILEGQLSATVDSISALFPTAPQWITLEHEDIEYALLDHLEDSHSELAIIGRSGSGAKGLKTALLGGTAETIIRHANCSVLVVPIIS